MLVPQRCNRGEIFGATSAMLAESVPPGGNRVKVSENLGATECGYVPVHGGDFTR